MLVSLSVRVVWSGQNPNTGEPVYDVVMRSEQGEAVESGVTLSRLVSGEQFTAFIPEPKGSSMPSRKIIKRVSMAQEKRSAEDIGGRRQSGSGARAGAKGDGRVHGRYRIENKFCFAKSLKVLLADLQKIRSECTGLETPLFQIEFKDKNTLRTLDRWVLMPWNQAKELINELPEADVDS